MKDSPARLLGPLRLEALALVAGGTLVVHDGRYAAAEGARWQDAVAETGHGYMSFLLPLVALALGAAIWLVARDAMTTRRRTQPPRMSFGRMWVVATVALVAVYVGQEMLEGMLAHGHAEGIAGVVADGGWSAFVLAPLVGALIAALLAGAHAAVRLVARSAPAVVLPAPAPASAPLFLAGPRLRDAMASHLAGRGPPLTG